MKDIYQLRHKIALFSAVVTSMMLGACGSYQAATYDDDGIYSSEPSQDTSKVVVVKEPASNNSKYYEEYFGRTVTDYGDIVEDDVFTDVDNYSSQAVVEHSTEVTNQSYGAWEDAGDNVTINVYNTRPYYYSFYRPYNYWDRYYYNDWAFCDWSWGWGGYYNSWYGYPYYYNRPFYYGYYGRRNYGYVYGPRNRRYAANYSGRYLDRRRITSPRPRTVTPRPRATTPRPRTVTPRTTAPRPHATTPRPRTVTPRPRTSAPRPRATTPRPRTVTPRPRVSTPRPRVTPRSAPRSTPRSSSSRSRRGRV
ncbi:MAG: hypothetical protein ACPGU9_06360 [Flavobacteriaceae bacterium]